MTTIEEIEMAVNQQIKAQEIKGFAYGIGNDLLVYVKGVFSQNVIEWIVNNFDEIVSYEIDFDFNCIIYNYVG
ncbi:MAG: hypothetical protein E3J43_06620 [Candidatus Heimdallarchaeota archaeon]|nr:MAG: hypothetical protein E3J43_06620 [Candidatus Heimdallarchaeota archaeon]